MNPTEQRIADAASRASDWCMAESKRCLPDGAMAPAYVATARGLLRFATELINADG